MILKYGTYAHEIAECSLSISQPRQFNEAGQVAGITQRWIIDGRKEGTSVADLTTKLAALEAAYSVNGQDLILFDVDGTTQTHHKIISADTIGGTRVVNLEYPEGRNAEYSTFRTYRITVEADIWTLDGVATIDSVGTYSANVDFTGTGGAKFVIRPTMSGAPVKQQIYAQTPVTCIQSGTKTGILGYPAADPPLYPTHEQFDRRQIKRSSTLQKGQPRYTTNWSYTFLKSTAF